MKDVVNVEYSIIEYIDVPKHLKSLGYKSSVTISLFELDKNSEIVSSIGLFNFKVKTNKEKFIKKIIVDKIHDLILYKSKNQKQINKKFDKIIKDFSKDDSN